MQTAWLYETRRQRIEMLDVVEGWTSQAELGRRQRNSVLQEQNDIPLTRYKNSTINDLMSTRHCQYTKMIAEMERRNHNNRIRGCPANPSTPLSPPPTISAGKLLSMGFSPPIRHQLNIKLSPPVTQRSSPAYTHPVLNHIFQYQHYPTGYLTTSQPP